MGPSTEWIETVACQFDQIDASAEPNCDTMPGGDKANDDPPGMASNLDLYGNATDLGYLPMQTATTFDVEEGIEQRRDGCDHLIDDSRSELLRPLLYSLDPMTDL